MAAEKICKKNQESKPNSKFRSPRNKRWLFRIKESRWRPLQICPEIMKMIFHWQDIFHEQMMNQKIAEAKIPNPIEIRNMINSSPKNDWVGWVANFQQDLKERIF